MPKPNRPELALFRGKTAPESLEKWTTAFAGGDKAASHRYASVLSRFTGRSEQQGSTEYEAYIGTYSPATRRVYAAALTEFFEWIATKYGRVVSPPEVTRKDAEDYVEWLATRTFSLEGEKLRDGDQRVRLALYDIVKELGTTDITSIVTKVPVWLASAHPSRSNSAVIDRPWLHAELGRMVLHGLLVRSPTMEELRRDDPRIGISTFVVIVPDGEQRHEVPLDEIFSYSLPRPRAVGRTTIVVRIAALSAFWKALMEADTSSGEGALIRHNVFADVGARVRVGLGADRRAGRARKGKLSPQLVERMLQAADGPQLTDKRDAALLWFLVLTGARVTESLRIRRDRPPASDVMRWPGWYDGRSNPPAVELVRKRGFHQRLPFPPYALKALTAFQVELSRHAPLEGTQSDNPKGLHYLAPSAIGWRYKLLSEEPDAPLFPPVHFWGANSTHNYQELKPNRSTRPDYRRPMTRNGADALLKRIAKKAGFTEDEQALVHAHAFRHFAATAMSRKGKPLREIQHMLGHESILTTETYVEADTSTEALSGQNEILDFIAGAAHEPPAPADTEAPRQPPVRASKPVIDTYAVPARAERPRAPPRPQRRPARATRELERLVREGLPAQSPKVAPDAVVPTGRGLVAVGAEGPAVPPGSEVRDGISPPSPVHAYAGLRPPPAGVAAGERTGEQERIEFSRVNLRRDTPKGRKLANLALPGDKRDLVQQNPWLQENYDPWPINYGIGESSLLPWFARGSSSANGEVTVEVRDKTGARRAVVVPPLPVLARKQMDPALAPIHAKKLWETVEHMRARWLRTSPTKAFGLDRWWGAFLKMLEGLERGTKHKFRWAPFDASATVGKDIRAHDEEYLITWLELNADRYTTTVRAFEDIERPRGKSDLDDEEWVEFQATWRDASVIGVSPAEELPDWFVLDDPVRDIYENHRDEWDWFVKWLGAITGQKLTKVRKDTITKELEFATEERLGRVAQARELLKEYYETIEQLRTASGDKDARESIERTRKFLVEQLEEYGVQDPKEALKEGTTKKRSKRDATIERLLGNAFPDIGIEEIDPNVLKSRLFDASTLRLDLSKHTISHTKEFREQFALSYDGRDSECVVRRAARGMWEHVKRHGIPVERGPKRSSEYSMLYSVMLSYMAWIFPCPAEIETRMAAELTGKDVRMVWLNGVRRASQRIVRIDRDMDEGALRRLVIEEGLDEKSADEVIEAGLLSDSLRAQVALPAPEVAAAIAKSAVKDGQVVVTPGGTVVRRRPAGARRTPVREAEPIEIEEPEESAWEELLSVGGEHHLSGDDMVPNAPPPRYMTVGAFACGADYVANAEQVLPSAIRMMAAMTLPF
jgi:site-specific recombinase XerD